MRSESTSCDGIPLLYAKSITFFSLWCCNGNAKYCGFLSATDGIRNYGGAVISESIQHLYLPMKKSEIQTVENTIGVKFSQEELNTLEIIDGKKEEQVGKGIYSTGAKRIKLEVVLTGVEEQLWFQKKN